MQDHLDQQIRKVMWIQFRWAFHTYCGYKCIW